MADKRIGELPAAADLYDDSLLAAEQQGGAVKVSGRLLKKFAQASVEQYVEAAAKKLGGAVTLKDAVRFEKGEGIEKKQENFAEEIASMVKG